MTLDFFEKYFGRAVFIAATLTMALAFAEAFARLFGRSLIAWTYSAGRLLELSAILLIFVVVQLLRQIRDQLRAGRETAS